MKRITSISKYFKKDPKTGSMIFQGKELLIKIPKRYETYDYLTVGNAVDTLGIFDMEFDGKEAAALLVLAMVEIVPTEVYEEEIEGATYVILKLEKGATFLTTTEVIQNSSIAYNVFVEFIAYGKIPYFLTYEALSTLFDTAKKMTGSNLDVAHSIFEMICAHLARDPDDVMKFYRHTLMRKDPMFIQLRSVSAGPESTAAKLIGSYFSDGLNSALVNESERHNHIEDLLRS